jgi:FkbM family methyltransferase
MTIHLLRQTIRNLGHPLLAVMRRWLTPSRPLPRLECVKIPQGPASGLTIQLPVPSELTNKICGNQYELQCIKVCQLLVQPNDNCWDIGAHYGFYTLLLAKLASRGQVHGFEPLPRLAHSIGLSIEKSHLSNACVHSLALSHSKGEATLRFAEQDTSDDSMNYLLEHGGVTTERSMNHYPDFSECQVPCTCLDQLELPQPQFIKMDVEGAEAAILSGGLRLLASARPRLLIELHGVDLTLRVSDILRSLGYAGRPLGPRGLIMPVLFVHHLDQFARELLRWQDEMDWQTTIDLSGTHSDRD